MQHFLVMPRQEMKHLIKKCKKFKANQLDSNFAIFLVSLNLLIQKFNGSRTHQILAFWFY